MYSDEEEDFAKTLEENLDELTHLTGKNPFRYQLESKGLMRQESLMKSLEDLTQGKLIYVVGFVFLYFFYYHAHGIFNFFGLDGSAYPQVFCRVGDQVQALRGRNYEEGDVLKEMLDSNDLMIRFTSDLLETGVSILDVKKGGFQCQSNWPHCQDKTSDEHSWVNISLDARGPLVDVQRFKGIILSAELEPEKCRDGDCTNTDKFGCDEPIECASVCAHIGSCQYWYWGYEEGSNMCWLTDHRVGSNPQGFVSGDRQCNPGAWALPGFQAALGRKAEERSRVIISDTKMTVKDCSDSCRMKPSCVAFEFKSWTMTEPNCILLKADEATDTDSWFGATTLAAGWAMFERLPKTGTLPGITLLGRDEGEGNFVDWRSSEPQGRDIIIGYSHFQKFIASPTGKSEEITPAETPAVAGTSENGLEQKPASTSYFSFLFGSSSKKENEYIPFQKCQEACLHSDCRAGLWVQLLGQSVEIENDKGEGHATGHCLMSEGIARVPKPCPPDSRCVSFRAAQIQDLQQELKETQQQLTACKKGFGVNASAYRPADPSSLVKSSEAGSNVKPEKKKGA